MRPFYAGTTDAPEISGVQGYGQTSPVIFVFTSGGTNSLQDMARSGENVVDLASFRALMVDAPYAGSLEQVGQGSASAIDMAPFYANTTNAPRV
jgi:hypothetical protein